MIKRKILVMAITGTLSTNAMATGFHNQGSVLGYGDGGNNHTLFANFKNPGFLAGDDTNREWGLGVSVGIDAEFFGVSDVGDNFDLLEAGIRDIEARIESGTLLDQAQAEREASGLVNDFFAANENLNINLKGSASLPIVAQTSNYGGFLVSASYTAGTTVNMIRYADSTVSANIPAQTLDVQTNNAMVFSAFQMTEIVAAYSTDLNRFFKPENGQINAGLRLKMMSGGFNHYGMGFDGFLDDGDDFSDQVADGLDEVTSFDNTDTQLGVDLGLQYIAKNYLLGVSVENINSPSFDYNIVGTPSAEVAGTLSKDISFEPKGRLEAAYYSENRHWTLGGFYDLNKTMDITGLETQKAGVSAAYATDSWYIPDVRIGYTNESTGNKMSRIHGGMTLGFLSLDVAANSFDFGEDVENSLAANLSMELAF